MLKQYSLYANTNMYEYGQLTPVCTYSEEDNGHFEAYVDKYMGKLGNKTCSEVHILVMHLDPANGVTEVVRNDYFSNPLKTKIEINVAAKKAKTSNPVFSTAIFDDLLDELGAGNNA